MEGIGCRLRGRVGAVGLAAHVVAPLRASNRDTLSLRFGFSCGALVAKLVRHRPWIYGFILDDDAKASFTTAENFSQLQESELSSQRVGFDRSTGRFAAAGGEFTGVNTIGGPTG